MSINYPAKYISEELPDSRFSVGFFFFFRDRLAVNQARDVSDTVRSNIHIIGVPEGEERVNRAEQKENLKRLCVIIFQD